MAAPRKTSTIKKTTKAPSKAGKARASSKDLEELLPTAAEARIKSEKLFSVLESSYLQSSLLRLQNLAKSQVPQLIIFEGASQEVRFSLAHYWACLLNCENSSVCKNCVPCLEIANHLTDDFIFFNGLEESIKIEPMRELKPIIANPPTNLKKRVIAFYEADAFTIEAGNSLLKILEEPNNTTSFIMTVSQKEQLLPTLVSRSTLFTLPSQVHREANETEKEILSALLTFFSQGTGFFDNYTAKKGFTKEQARLICHLLISHLALAYTHKQQDFAVHGLAEFFAQKITPEKSFILTDFIEESQLMLESTAPNCPLIIDTLLVQMYMLLLN